MHPVSRRRVARSAYLAALGMALTSAAVSLPSSAEAGKPAKEHGVPEQGWNFKLERKALPMVVATGRLHYYPHGDKGCYQAYTTGYLKTVIGSPSGQDAHLWLVGQDCHSGKWFHMRDTTSPSAGITVKLNGTSMSNAKNVTVWLCNEGEIACTIPDPRCPTCGGKPHGNPNAAEAKEKAQRKPKICGYSKASCPKPPEPMPPLRR